MTPNTPDNFLQPLAAEERDKLDLG